MDDHAHRILTLQRLDGLSGRRVRELAEVETSLDDLIASGLSRTGPGKPKSTEDIVTKAELSAARDKAGRETDKAMRLKVDILTPLDPRWPARLRDLGADAPDLLYVKGTLTSIDGGVACIGTRKPTAFGATVAERLSGHLARGGFTVVSGLAQGIDGICHRAALDNDAPTVAILANGLDTVYPRAHARMADEIVAKGGALVSENRFGTEPKPVHLVRRNRLQSGTSAATVVMQTDVEGGTMHTAKFAIMQERMLFAPLPQGRYADEPESRGNVALSTLAGDAFVLKVNAYKTYHHRIMETYAERPPATAIKGREDYDLMIRMIGERMASERHAPMPLETEDALDEAVVSP